MANVTPTVFFPNYQLLTNGATTPAEGVFIPLTDLKGLTSVEANADTGDGREVMRSMWQTSSENLATLSSELRPSEMTLVKGNSQIQTGENNTVRENYSASFDVVYNPENVTLTAE